MYAGDVAERVAVAVPVLEVKDVTSIRLLAVKVVIQEVVNEYPVATAAEFCT
jgi:hypothetical protein